VSTNKELANRVEYVISLAKQVPFYKRKAEEAGLDLDKIKTPTTSLKPTGRASTPPVQTCRSLSTTATRTLCASLPPAQRESPRKYA